MKPTRTIGRGWLLALSCWAVVVITLFAVVVVAQAGAQAAPVELKLATLAPEGSVWWRIFTQADKRLRELTHNEMRARIYAGGVAGDEPVMVRKMRVGQLQGGAITSVGLAEIEPNLLALQAPGLFNNWHELDAVRGALSQKLSALLERQGYVVLAWGDVGFNRIFSTSPVRRPADLAAAMPWCWTQDDVYRQWFEAAHVKPVLLGVPDVLSSLQTGLINAFSTPPLAAVSMQWFRRAKYMLDMPVSVTIGAVLVTTRLLDQLTEEQRRIMWQIGDEIEPLLSENVRRDNVKAVDSIRNAGVQIIEPTSDELAEWARLATRAQDQAATRNVYPAELLSTIRDTLQEVRVSTRAP